MSSNGLLGSTKHQREAIWSSYTDNTESTLRSLGTSYNTDSIQDLLDRLQNWDSLSPEERNRIMSENGQFLRYESGAAARSLLDREIGPNIEIAANSSGHFGSLLLQLYNDLYTWTYDPQWLCCLIRNLLAIVGADAAQVTNTPDSVDKARTWLLLVIHILEIIVSILESSIQGVAISFSNLLYRLGRLVLLATVQTTNVLIAEARSYVLERIMPPADRMKGGECLPFEQMLHTIVNFVVDDHGLLSYLTRQFIEAMRGLNGELRQLSDKSFQENLAEHIRLLIKLLRAILELLEMGQICQPTFTPEQQRMNEGQEDPLAGRGLQETSDGIRIPSQSGWQNAIMADLSGLGSDPIYTGSSARTPEAAPSGTETQSGTDETTQDVPYIVPDADVARVFEYTFDIAPDKALAFAQASRENNCGAVLSKADIETFNKYVSELEK